MLCEMCGKEVATPNRVRVEGSVLMLCADCSKYGTVLAGPALAPPAGEGPAPSGTIEQRLVRGSRRLEERDLFRELPDLELAEDWPKRIRLAREKLGWSPEDFGKKLNEKKSIVLKLEAGQFRPPDTMIPRLEHLLKIRLRADAAAKP
ncbi:MAG TPA: multiprotein-bridging factor 1 family protein [Thermoplasmata archaeon]|nr:multiprotein-bridging factor 1 family protein [Thermoplasmata archaeon]